MKFKDYIEEGIFSKKKQKEVKALKLFVVTGNIYDSKKGLSKSIEKYIKQTKVDIENDATSRESTSITKTLNGEEITSSDILIQIDVESNKDKLEKLKRLLKSNDISFSEGY